jgi:hypothetical protein
MKAAQPKRAAFFYYRDPAFVISSRVAGRNLAFTGKDFSLSLEMTNHRAEEVISNRYLIFRSILHYAFITD